MHGRIGPRICLVALAGLVLCLIVPASAAQVQVGGDLALKNRYVWRGLTHSNASVSQLDLFLTYGARPARLTAGFWTNIELSDVHRHEGIGFDRTFFGENNIWSEVSLGVGPWNVATGWTWYFFRREIAIGLPRDAVDTHEIYGRLELLPWFVVPRLTVWHDIDTVAGTYIEGELTLRIPGWSRLLLPVGSLFLTGRAGYSLGQEINTDIPNEAAYFSNRGLTHIDLSAAFTVGYLEIGATNTAAHIEFHLQFNQDPNTRWVSQTRQKNAKLWLGITFTSFGPRCRPEREICKN